MTNFTRVIITIQWNTKMCLMELAHHQPRLLDPLLHLLLHSHAFLQLRICGLYPYLVILLIPWADGKTRWTRLFIGGVMGDQQEGDRYTGEPCVCHRCFAPRNQYLDSADFEVKTMRKIRARVEFAAAGGNLKGRSGKRVVRWDPDGRNVTAGPGIIYIMYIIAIILLKCIMHIIFSLITILCRSNSL